MWEAVRHDSSVSELADFAILLLSIVPNSAGMERTFSDLKIKKTQLRNRMSLERLGMMSKVRVFHFAIYCTD